MNNIFNRTIQRAAAVLLLALCAAQTAGANDAVTYIDMDGKTKTVTEYTEVTTDMTADGYGYIYWSSGTYVVKSSVTLSGCIRYDGEVIDLIVCDGATLTVNGSSNGAFDGNTLNIYAQSNGTGMGVVNVKKQTKCGHLNIAGGKVTLDDDGVSYGLYVYSGDACGLTVNGGDVTIQNSYDYQGAIFFNGNGFVTLNGGKLTVTNSMGNGYKAIEGYGNNTLNFNGGTAVINGKIRDFKNINLNGGNVTVNGEIYKYYGYTVTYDFTRATDSYYINAFSNNIYEYATRTVQVKEGVTFLCGGNSYSGTLSADEISAISGQRMTPDVSDHFSVNDAGTEYTIHTAKGWGLFCDALQDNDTYNRFSGKTVRLGDDITVSRMAGSDKHDFCGTFDGDEHTITLDGNSANGCYTLFRNAVGATIRDLHVTGTITTAGKYAAGFISGMWGNVTIENCRSSVIIRSSVSGDGTHGGFVAVNNSGTLDITGCTFDGKLLTTGTTATSHCGGFVGWNDGTLTITNSLYAPAALADGETEVIDGDSNPSATFARNGATITNSYYTRTLGTAQGKQSHCITAGENVTVAHSGTATEYTTSGITAYKDGNTQLLGLKYGDVLYAGENDQVSLTLNHSEAPTGYSFTDYEASNGGTITGTSNPYTLTLPNEDVTVSTTLTPNTYYVHFDGNGNTGDSMADQTFHYDEEQALSANAFTYANHTFIGWSLTPSLTPNENDNENNSTIFADQESILNLTATDGETIYLYAQWILTPVPYIDQNGEQQFCTDYTVITEDEEYGCLSPDHLEAGGWYIFDDNLSVDTYTLSGSGAANIILVDGANYEFGGLDGNIAIKGSLNIYGQSNGTGNLELKGAIASHSSETDGKPAIQGDITLYGGSLKAYGGDGGGPSASQAYLCANGIDGSVTIYGGSLTSEGGTPFYYNKYGSCGISGNVTFYGGSLTAKGFNTDDPINDYEPGYGIGGNVTLSWTNTTDRFYANSIRGTVTVAQGKAFTSDGTDLYCGSVNPGSINGKTLSPAVEVTLACGLTPGSGIISLTPDPSPAGEGGNENHYYAKVGQTVTVAVPSTGCTLDSITPNTVVLNDNGDGTYSFTVPAEDVIVSGGDRTAPVHSDNYVWVYGTLYQDACLACFDMDLFLPQDQDLFDDCSPMTITHTDTRTGNDRDGWTIRRDYEVTDACGNTLHEFIKVSGRDQTPPMATNPEMKKDTLWAYAQCLCDSIRVINDLSELKTLFGLSDECTGDDISLVSKTRTFKIGNQGNHCPDTVVVAYTVADTYNNQSTFYHAQLIQDTTGPTFSIVPLDTSLCVDPDGDYVATVQRVAATATIEDIHDNCTRLQGNITVSAPTIIFDPSENDNGGYTTDDNGIRTYYQVWSVTDSCGNTTRGTLEIHLYPLATIRIDSLDNQTITYGEDIKEVEVHSQYANVSVPDLGASDGITFSGNRLMGQPSAAGTYVYHPTATSWHECNSVETSVTVKVNPRPITITAASAIKKYDGKPLTSNDYICTLTPPFADMYYRILVGNDSIASVTITGSQTNVGTSQNVPREARITITTEPTADKSPSYAISYGNGTLEVIKNDTLIRVIPGSGSKVYDGTPFTMTAHDDFTVTGVPDGLTWTATADGTVTNVIPGDGEKAVNAVTSFRIFDFNNVDVTNYFTNIDISATGTLRVIPSMLYLADNADNTAIIGKFNGQGYDVTLQGRTLWKDGNWNTLCLPFDLTAAQVTTQLAPSELKELDVVNTYDEEGNVVANGTYQTKLADDGTLYLYFTDATEISAGTPYIIKWNATTPDYIENPTFKDVVIDKDASTEVTFTGGKFVGSYSPVVWQTENQSVLFLGADNKLYWPQPADADHPVTIGAFRAYFDLSDGAGVREIKLNLEDNEVNEVKEVNASLEVNDDSWFTLDGRKLDKQPTKKGLYIHKGSKVVIK